MKVMDLLPSSTGEFLMTPEEFDALYPMETCSFRLVHGKWVGKHCLPKIPKVKDKKSSADRRRLHYERELMRMNAL